MKLGIVAIVVILCALFLLATPAQGQKVQPLACDLSDARE